MNKPRNTNKFDQMPLVPKPKPLPKILIPPKREVLSRDIVNISAPKKSHKKTLKKFKTGFAAGRFKLAVDQVTIWRLPTEAKKVFSWKSLSFFTATLLLLISLFQAASYLNIAKSASGIVLGDATSAYDELNSANQSINDQDFTGAKSKFAQAQESLVKAQAGLDKFRLLSLIAPPARSADNILTGAYFLAEAGKNLSTAMQLFDQLTVDSQGIENDTFIESLKQNHALLKNSLLLLNYAQENFDSTSGLPSEYDATLVEAKEQISTLRAVLSDLVGLEDLFLSFFGTEPKTYLLVFENYDEIRATGGFIGTYGVLKYENGKINDLKIESIYNIDGSLSKLIAAPGPFQPEINKWALRDSNWFADFPTSAQKMLQFFEMESQTADGVIAFTPQIFTDILKMLGPVDMPEYGVTITAENFQAIVQDQTSYNYDKKLNQPKKFLDDFAPVLLDRLSNLKKEEWFNMFQLMQNNFSQRHMMLYSADSQTQEKISGLGFDGRILEAEHDYLSVVNSNLGGTKTDLDIKQSVFYSSEIGADGKITNIVKITRQNTADENNKNFMRILVPQGSVLIGAQGFINLPQNDSTAEGFATDPDLRTWDQNQIVGNVKVRSEAGKTEFTGWVTTQAKQTSEVTVKYVLPMTIETNFIKNLLDSAQSHSLLFQKQPGNISTYFEGQWVINDAQIAWTTDNASVSGNIVKFNALTQTDQYWGLVLKK